MPPFRSIASSFPLPIRAKSFEATPEGFTLVMPGGAPKGQGKATVSFAGFKVFIGEAERKGDIVHFVTERTLPELPLTREESVLWHTPETRRVLMERLEHETKRRGQPIPVVPESPPAPTEGALIRASRASEFLPLE